MSMTFYRLKSSVSVFNLVKLRTCTVSANTSNRNDIPPEKCNQSFKYHADLIKQIEGGLSNIKGPITVKSLPKLMLLEGKQHVSAFANKTLTESHQCRALHTEPAPRSLIVYPFVDNYNYNTEKNENINNSSSSTGELLLDRLPTDLETVFSLYDPSRNYVKPYAYTADDIIMDGEVVSDIKLSHLNTSELDELFRIDKSKSSIESFEDKQKDIDEVKHVKSAASSSPYGGNFALECAELIGFQKLNINALLGDINQYISLTSNNDKSEDIGPDKVFKALSNNVTNNIKRGLHTEQAILYCSSSSKDSAPGIPDPRPDDLPNADQLRLIQDIITESVPKLFTDKHDYRMYRQDIVFENNYVEKPYVTQGITAYVLQLVKLRIYAHFTFANVRMQVVRIDINEKIGTVKLNWRLSGIPQQRTLAFWRFMPWNYSKNLDKQSDWNDGISTLYVDGTGVIYKHVLDKVLRDTEKEEVKKDNVIEKLKKLTVQPGLAASPTSGASSQ